jgi:hypothetical protein
MILFSGKPPSGYLFNLSHLEIGYPRGPQIEDSLFFASEFEGKVVNTNLVLEGNQVRLRLNYLRKNRNISIPQSLAHLAAGLVHRRSNLSTRKDLERIEFPASQLWIKVPSHTPDSVHDSLVIASPNDRPTLRQVNH